MGDSTEKPVFKRRPDKRNLWINTKDNKGLHRLSSGVATKNSEPFIYQHNFAHTDKDQQSDTNPSKFLQAAFEKVFAEDIHERFPIITAFLHDTFGKSAKTFLQKMHEKCRNSTWIGINVKKRSFLMNRALFDLDFFAALLCPLFLS